MPAIREPAPVKNESAPPILPGVKAPRQPKLAGPPLAGKLGAPGAVAALPKPTKVVATQTAHGTTAKTVPFRPLPGVFAGAPQLAKAYKTAPAEKATPAKSGRGGGGFSLGTIVSPAGSLAADIAKPVAGAIGAAATDIPRELQGTGVVERGIKGLASAAGSNIISEAQHAMPSPVAAAISKLSMGAVTPGQVGSAAAHLAGNSVRDVVELPAQVLPTLYTVGKAALDQIKRKQVGGNPAASADLQGLVKSYLHESALGSLATGHPGRALQNAYNNPVNAGLEISGGAGALDRIAGAAARSGALGEGVAAKTALSDVGATTVSRQPQDLLGNAKAPTDPYSKRLTTRLRQGGQDPTLRPGESVLEHLKGKGLNQQLVKHFDRQTGTLEAVRRTNRDSVTDTRMKAVTGKSIKGSPLSVKIPGTDAVNAFARGLLADPKVLNEHGQPLYRDQLSKLVELHAKPVEGELPFQAHNRMGKVAEYQSILDDKAFQRNPKLAHAAAVKYAQDMHRLEPELVAHDYLTPHSIRVAKLADPFQFHWQGRDPQFEEQPPLNAKGLAFTAAEKARDDAYKAREGSRVEVNRARIEMEAKVALGRKDAEAAKAAVNEATARHKANIAAHSAAVARAHGLTAADPMDLHESPFSIAEPRKAGHAPTGNRIHIPISQVERDLLGKHGVDPKNIGFVSNRPYVNDSAAYYRSTTDPTKAGFNPMKQRTGAAFLRGQYDTSHDALVRQHLTNQGLIDQARGSKMQVKTYALTKAHMADLLQQKVDKLPAGEQPGVRGLIAELRSGSTYFEAHGGTAAWDQAKKAIEEVQRQNPDLKLQPGRIAHPYAPAKQLDQIAKHTLEGTQDRLDPALWEQDRGTDRFPTDPTLQRLDSGPIGVWPKAIADRMHAYEKQTGSANANLLRQPASWWRRANVAFSAKHIPGLLQELGIRAAVNKIGPLSYLRGRRLLNLVEEIARDPAYLKSHPEAEFDAQRLKAEVGGTVAQQTKNLEIHVNQNQLSTTLPGDISHMFKAVSSQKIAGAPLRAATGIVRGYSATASKILSLERKYLEAPAQIAGLGKHANDEARLLMGKSLPVFKAVTDVQRKMGEGLLDQAGMDSAARKSVEFWGDWASASPRMKNALAVAPFFNWFRNSLRFLYVTLPAHHPIKTALLTTLEDATAEQRRAIGQGHGASEKLEPEQQGGIPIGGGYTANQQYYTPQGAVTGGIAGTAAGLFIPEFSDALKVLTGSNSFGETLVNANKEPITDPGERITLAASALLESFNPLIRDAATVARGGRTAETGSALWDLKAKAGEATADPIAKALGIKSGALLGLYDAFRPLKTTEERNEKGEPRGGTSAPALPPPPAPPAAAPPPPSPPTASTGVRRIPFRRVA